jgi:hypothetical protein
MFTNLLNPGHDHCGFRSSGRGAGEERGGASHPGADAGARAAHRQWVQTANQLRGQLNEFGIVRPKGQAVPLARLGEVMTSAPFAALPAVVQELVARLREEITEQTDKVKPAEAMLIQAVKADANCRLLMSIPNIGAINAAALSVALEAPGRLQRFEHEYLHREHRERMGLVGPGLEYPPGHHGSRLWRYVGPLGGEDHDRLPHPGASNRLALCGSKTLDCCRMLPQ